MFLFLSSPRFIFITRDQQERVEAGVFHVCSSIRFLLVCREPPTSTLMSESFVLGSKESMSGKVGRNNFTILSYDCRVFVLAAKFTLCAKNQRRASIHSFLHPFKIHFVLCAAQRLKVGAEVSSAPPRPYVTVVEFCPRMAHQAMNTSLSRRKRRRLFSLRFCWDPEPEKGRTDKQLC